MDCFIPSFVLSGQDCSTFCSIDYLCARQIISLMSMSLEHPPLSNCIVGIQLKSKCMDLI
uniref:Uncharacterized protein n=1 Tax=Arundo donax TaxID=35708 RepID=A0A0A8XMZ6_ARUDO